MKYARIRRYVAETPWAITVEKMADLLSVLTFRAAGGEFTPEEIRAQIGEAPPATAAKQGAIAVLPLRGVIAHRMGTLEESSGGVSAERFGRLFQAALADPSIGTVVLDVDSPGGTVPGVHELHGQMLEAKGRSDKRVVAIANSLMASAAYWIASAADEIVAIPTATVGGIGVFTVHEDLRERAKQLGVAITLISAGKYKTEGNPFEPLSDEARERLQARVDEAYGFFVKDVAKGRGVPVAAVRGGYGEGRALGAKDALAAGLINRIATFEETIGQLARGGRVAGMRAEDGASPLAAAAAPETGGGDLEASAEPDAPSAAAVPPVDDLEADRRRRLERF